MPPKIVGRYIQEIFNNFCIDRKEPDNADTDVMPATPFSTRSLEDKEVRSLQSVEIIDDLFRMVKIDLGNRKRWNRLFCAAGKRHEARLDRIREKVYLAVSLDDVENLRKLKLETPAKLWQFWGYDMDLNLRSTVRNRPKLLEILPVLNGEEFHGAVHVAERKAAIDARPERGSSDDKMQQQRGEVLIRIVFHAYQKMKEIDLRSLEDELTCELAGEWQGEASFGVPRLNPARGVNFGRWQGEYGGWRPLHFCTGNTHAKKTSLPAMRQLVDARADPCLPDASGASPLHLAVFRGNIEAVDFLLEVGAYVEGRDKFGMTPILSAARTRNSEIIRRIVSWVVPNEQAKPLLVTEHERNAQMYSLVNGAKMHKKIAAGQWFDAKELLQTGDGNGDNLAHVNFADSMGLRAVHVAASSVKSDAKCVEIIRALTSFRADVDSRTLQSAETPLHVASRLGRPDAVRSLLRLKAHPTLMDSKGRTPLMMASSAPCQICGCGYVFKDTDQFCGDKICGAKRSGRLPPDYNGVLRNPPIDWVTIASILDWQGYGGIPGTGPKPREAQGYSADVVKKLFSTTSWHDDMKKKKKHHDSEDGPEDEGDEDEADAEEKDPARPHDTVDPGVALSGITPMDAARARVDALIALAWDDQKIMDSAGRFNRGDRMQLFSHVFDNYDRGQKIGFLKPQDRKLRLIWRNLTAPLLQMQLEKTTTPKQSQFLEYLLATVFGKRGATFGALASAALGTKAVSLPTWDEIDETLRENEDLDDRIEELRILCFRGSKPKRQKWVGAVWRLDEFPREPEMIPWDAFHYVDEETADWLNSRGGKPPPNPEHEEAYKGNSFEPLDANFHFDVVAKNEPPPHKGDLLQMANRLIVDEACGQWSIDDMACWDRSRTLGDYLLCPMLMESLESLRGEKEIMAAAAAHHTVLRYTASQMDVLKKYLTKPRMAYKESWTEVRNFALRVLSDDVAPRIRDLNVTAPTSADPEWGTNGPALRKMQAACLPADDVHWLKERQSTLAYVELLRAGVFNTADEFADIVTALASHSAQEGLNETFWRAAFGLMLWARATPLVDILNTELKRRVPAPAQGVFIFGPRRKTRSAVLWDAVVDGDKEADGKGSPRENGDVASPRQPTAVERERSVLAAAAKSSAGKPKANFSGGYLAPEDRPAAPGQVVKKARPKTPPPPQPPLPKYYTDVITAEIICRNEEVMMETLEKLLAPSEPSVAEPPSLQSEPEKIGSKESAEIGSKESSSSKRIETKTKTVSNFTVVKVESDFHKPHGQVFPRACSIKLLCRIGCDTQVRGEDLRQLAEVELIFPYTHEARWLAKVIEVEAWEQPPPERKKIIKKKKPNRYA